MSQISYKNGPLTKVICDTRRIKKSGKYPVKLRVTLKTDQRYYPLGEDLTIEEWAQVQDPATRGVYKQWRLQFHEQEMRAQAIIDQVEVFSFPEFEKRFVHGQQPAQRLSGAFGEYIEQLRKEGRYKTAVSYDQARKSFEVFRKGAHLRDVTVQFLKEYENWMRSTNRSDTTIGIYTRSLRTIINLAIDDHRLDREAYPFGRRRYQVPQARNIKKALTLDEVGRILAFKCTSYSGADRARDLWLFSYLCGGMNFKDMAYLKYKNIRDDSLVFIREKTRLTSRVNQRPIALPLLDEAMEIIRKWGNQPVLPETYIFPILNKPGDPEKELDQVALAIHHTNKWMRHIALVTGIRKDVTTYVARHTFATVLKRSGASMELISEQLGHSSLKTTESYLDSFEDTVKREYARKLLDFKKEE